MPQLGNLLWSRSNTLTTLSRTAACTASNLTKTEDIELIADRQECCVVSSCEFLTSCTYTSRTIHSGWWLSKTFPPKEPLNKTFLLHLRNKREDIWANLYIHFFLFFRECHCFVVSRRMKRGSKKKRKQFRSWLGSRLVEEQQRLYVRCISSNRIRRAGEKERVIIPFA